MAGTCMSRFRQGKASSSLHLYRWCNFISHSGFQSEHPSCHSFRYARRQLRAVIAVIHDAVRRSYKWPFINLGHSAKWIGIPLFITAHRFGDFVRFAVWRRGEVCHARAETWSSA